MKASVCITTGVMKLEVTLYAESPAEETLLALLEASGPHAQMKAEFRGHESHGRVERLRLYGAGDLSPQKPVVP